MELGTTTLSFWMVHIFRGSTTNRNELSRPESGMANGGFRGQMQTMEDGGDDNDHGQQRCDPKARWRSGESQHCSGACQSDQRADDDLRQGVHTQHEPRYSNDNCGEQSRRQDTVTAIGKHDGQAARNDSCSGDMTAWALDVHRPEHRPTAQEHQLEAECRKKCRRHHDKPGQRAAPPALYGKCNGNGEYEREDHGLIGKIGKVSHTDLYRRRSVNKGFRTAS